MPTGARDWASAWQDLRIEVEEYRELDAERVLVLARIGGRGKRSGIELSELGGGAAYMLHIRDGKVTRWVGYYDRERALADLGVEEAVSAEATTRDLEEAYRGGIEAGNRRDFDAALSVWTPDAVWELSPVGIGVIAGDSLMGREAIRKFSEDLTGAFEDFATEIEEFHNLGSGVTWSILVLRSRPHGSDSFVEARPAIVTLWRCDRIERATNYTDIDAARAAAERLAQERG